MEAEGVDYTKYGFIGYGEWYENKVHNNRTLDILKTLLYNRVSIDALQWQN
tara:strand:- start:4903 stop:5055 length:153 start_codon:yes stop_codon:yes gene_type:complete